MNRLLATLLSLSLAATTAAQDPGDPPQPGPEHKKLAVCAGTWDAHIESIGPDGQPSTSRGVSRMRIGLGGFWLFDDFEADFEGMKFAGHGMTGYDPIKRKYIGTWIDSVSPHLMVLEGDFDASGKTLTMTGIGIGMDGKPARHRMASTHVDDATMRFTMHVGPEDAEVKVMTITYKRRATAVEASDTKR